MRRDLRERLERLERRIPRPPNLPSQEEREDTYELAVLHFDAWLKGGTLEDVPEQHRDAEMWAEMEEYYGPAMLELERASLRDGSGEPPEVALGFDPSDDYPDDEDAPGKLL